MSAEEISSYFKLRYDPDYAIPVKPGIALRTIAMDLNMVFSALEGKIPQHLHKISEMLMEKLGEHVTDSENKDAVFNCESKTVSTFPELVHIHRQAALELMSYDEYSFKTTDDVILIKYSHLWRPIWHTYYYIAESLVDLIGRSEALSLVRGISEMRINHWLGMRVPHPVDLQTMYQERTKLHRGFTGGTFAMLKDGRFCEKTTKCFVHDMVASFADPEIANAAICHGDYRLISQMNANFVLTRKRTLIAGEDFCDYCIHDKRIHSEFLHPSEGLWAQL